MKIKFSKNPTVIKIPIEKWINLTDELQLFPEATIENVIRKVQIVKKLLLEKNKTTHFPRRLKRIIPINHKPIRRC